MGNKLYLIGFVFLMLFYSCINKKTEVIIPKLEITGVADSVMVMPGSSQQYLANPTAKWTLTDANAGVIDSTGKVTIGNTEGIFTVIAINSKNNLDTLKRRIIVLKQAELFNEFRKGGYVLSFRHAAASTGSDQIGSKVTDWWKSCDQTLARQITKPIGQNQSDSTGKVIKFLKIPIDTTLTSEFCRCKQTAEYFNLGVPNKEVKELTFSVYDEANRYANSMNLFASKPINTKNYIAVGHAGYNKVPNPAPLASLEWGDCAVFKQVAVGAEPKYITTIKVKEWTGWAKVLK
ncbi:MAG: hypothetical protein V4683_07350 [Bacteroidota bacterium]